MRRLAALESVRTLGMVVTVVIVLSGCAATAADGGDTAVNAPSATPADSATPDSATPDAAATGSPAASATASANPSPSANVPASKAAATTPARFATVQAGGQLPAGSQCAAWVRARPKKENKGVNTPYNRTTGQHIDPDSFSKDPASSARKIALRIDGQFTGTTEEILLWAACKWGIDEDVVKAQAAIESWWRQTTLGDFGTDAAACPAGHGLGVDGQAGKCPQSYGILQNRYPFMNTAFPGAMKSTAMSADLAYGIWRTCFEGNETWLNTVERGEQYKAGDMWGCVGRWFSGRWHVAASEEYVGRVKGYLNQRIWETPNFQQP